jgi:hypothetical protein
MDTAAPDRASADIKELANARPSRQEISRPPEESSVIPRRTRRAGHRLSQFPGCIPVSGTADGPAQ